MINEAEQIVYHFMHYGWASKEHQSVSHPPSCTKKKQESRTGRDGQSQLPSPCQPASLWLLQTNRNSEDPQPPADPASLQSTEAWRGSFSNTETGVLNSYVILRSHRRAKYTKLCLWFSESYPMALWCGKERIIMAIRSPAPQSVTVGIPRSIAKQQSLFKHNQNSTA